MPVVTAVNSSLPPSGGFWMLTVMEVSVGLSLSTSVALGAIAAPLPPVV